MPFLSTVRKLSSKRAIETATVSAIAPDARSVANAAPASSLFILVSSAVGVRAPVFVSPDCRISARSVWVKMERLRRFVPLRNIYSVRRGPVKRRR